MKKIFLLFFAIVLCINAYSLSNGYCQNSMSCGGASFSLTDTKIQLNDFGLNSPKINIELEQDATVNITYNSSILIFNSNNSITYWNGSEMLLAPIDWLPNVEYTIIYNENATDLLGINFTINEYSNITKYFNVSIQNIKPVCNLTYCPNNILNIYSTGSSAGTRQINTWYYDDVLPLCDSGCTISTYSFASFSDGSSLLFNNFDLVTAQDIFNFSYIPLMQVDAINNCSLLINGIINRTNITSVTNNRINYFYNLTLSNSYYNFSLECYSNGTQYLATQQRILIDSVLPAITNLTLSANAFYSNEKLIASMNCTDANIQSVYVILIEQDGSYSTYTLSTTSAPIYNRSLSINAGTYNITGYCADYSNTVATSTQTITSVYPIGGIGSGGGGVTATLKFGNFTIYPSNNITYNYVPGLEQIGEFRIINKEPKENTVKVKFNKLKSTPNIDAIFEFLNNPNLELELNLNPTGVIKNPFTYVRYKIIIPKDITLEKGKEYKIILDVTSQSTYEQVTINILTGNTFYDTILFYLNYPLYTFSETFNVLTINETNQETETSKNIEFSFRVWHALIFVSLIALLYFVGRGKRRNRVQRF